MTPHERAYILRIAAILEIREGPQGVAILSRALHDLNAAWDERAIDRAVAHVRSAVAHISYTTFSFEIAA